MSIQFQHRNEIDGLRAVAVIPVILFHAGSTLFGGGFAGVDVFFVISGYLITTIIYRAKYDSNFTFAKFYERRARRILPALFVVTIFSLAASVYFMPQQDLRSFLRSVVAASLFASNIFFKNEVGYFNTTSGEKPLLHTWSLSVEEQYYIVFPIAFTIFWTYFRRNLVPVMAMFAVCSFLAAEIGSRYFPVSAFYLATTRAWELLIGAIAAIMLQSQTNRFHGHEGFGIAGLVLLLCSFIIYDESTRFPSVYTLLPVSGTLLIILYATEGTIAGKFLSTPMLTLIGGASYSIYLWHQPIFAFTRIASLEYPSCHVFLLGALAAITLGFISWKWIEGPCRNHNIVPTRIFVIGAVIGTFLFISVGWAGASYIRNFGSNVSFVDTGAAKITVPLKFGGLKDARGKDCSDKQDPRESCVFSETENPQKTIVIIGDSHARVLSEAVREAIRGTQYSLIDMTKTGCPFLPRLQVYSSHAPTDCTPDYQAVRAERLRTMKNVTVIFASRLPLYINGGGFDNTIGGRELRDPLYASTAPRASRQQRLAEIENSFREAVMTVLEVADKVIIVQPVPTNGWHPIVRMNKINRIYPSADHDSVTKMMSIPWSASISESNDADTIIHSVSSLSEKIIVIDPKDIFCDKTKRICRAMSETEMYYVDRDHLSLAGNRLVTKKIVKSLDNDY